MSLALLTHHRQHVSQGGTQIGCKQCCKRTKKSSGNQQCLKFIHSLPIHFMPQMLSLGLKKKIELHFHCLAALKSVKFHTNAGITKTADELC